MAKHSRTQLLKSLRQAVEELKNGQQWPEYWRTSASKTVARTLDVSPGGVNAIISVLDPDEWDYLKLPEPAASMRPKSAIRLSGEVVETYGTSQGPPTQEKPKPLTTEERKHQRREQLLQKLRILIETINPDRNPLSRNRLAGAMVESLGYTPAAAKMALGRDLTYQDLQDLGLTLADRLTSDTMTNGHDAAVHEKPPEVPYVVLAEKARRRYLDALESLRSEERTCQGLAHALGKPQYVVDCYVRANPDFASQLIDGSEVFNWLTGPKSST